MPLHLTTTLLNGVLVFRTDVFTDDRGFFTELFRSIELSELHIPVHFAQENLSTSKKHVIRGLHTQPNQGKLLSVVRGSVFLVELDVRRESDTFGTWASVTLDADKPHVVWIPPGFANGFCALHEGTVVCYKCTAGYDPNTEVAINPLDPQLNIPWPAQNPILSTKDATAPLFSEITF